MDKLSSSICTEDKEARGLFQRYEVDQWLERRGKCNYGKYVVVKVTTGGKDPVPKPECGHVPRGQASLRTCRMPTGHHGPHFDYEPLDKPWQCWLDDGTPLVVRTADKLEQGIAKIESVGARTRQDLEDAKRDEEWSNVAAYHNQALAEDNVLRILRGFR